MGVIITLLYALGGYLIGSIPSGYLIAKFNGIDIHKIGSGNTGATNVFRKLGIKWALLVGIIDFGKGLIVALLIQKTNFPVGEKLILSWAPIIGHVFPVWLGFKGGKGVGTGAGVMAAILGWQFFLVGASVWLILLGATRIMSLTNLILVLFLPLVFWQRFHNLSYVIFGCTLIVFIWWTHRTNIQRLATGRELRLKF